MATAMSATGGKCGSCGAPLRWVKVGDRWMPLDRTPDSGGNILIEADGAARVLGTDGAATAAANGRLLYRSHFSTCPDAAGWRRGAT